MSHPALRAALLFIAGGLMLSGCPDPTAGGTAGQGPGAPAGGPAAGGPGAGAPGAGGPGAGVPGGEGAGAPPMGAGAAGGGRPDQARFSVAEGEGVEISGTFEYAGSATGSHRIDFLTMDTDGPPTLVHALSLDAAGPWSVEAPKNFGKVYIVAFIDKKGDGPSSDDPSGRIADQVEIGTKPVTGLTLTLKDDADLGNLTPGAAGPPEGAGTPDAALPPSEGGAPGVQDGVEPEGEAVDAEAPGLGTPPPEGSLPPGGGDAPVPEGEGKPNEAAEKQAEDAPATGG